MSKYYLEFEKPIKELDEKLIALRVNVEPESESAEEIKHLQDKRENVIKKIFKKLSRWQRVQLARHPNRPYCLDYIQRWSPDFLELHGDRHFADDSAVITGMGSIDDRPVMYIGQQKGRNTKENLHRNFGMMRPEGYRKALRVMKLAEKFHVPVISLIDTPGAYPGIGAEERGQGEAIAKNLLEMSRLKTPLISVVIGEGASGGALGIGVSDKMLMLENTWYSVISPEGCASILWHDSSKAPDAAEALQVIPEDLRKMGICDRIIQEPLGGAHRDYDTAADILKAVLLEELDVLKDVPPDAFLERRIEKYDRLGVFLEGA
ncbi:MAG: acetyl-CoA carboxylase carboxyltransferase subunit alpha [Candidatus Marinimicrobia bacterium]|nr:acetyl-CoA carboxylase carboxyltransferase subunit alpha [Candidatus Neomarinimicrobiota bacterium]